MAKKLSEFEVSHRQFMKDQERRRKARERASERDRRQREREKIRKEREDERRRVREEKERERDKLRRQKERELARKLNEKERAAAEREQEIEDLKSDVKEHNNYNEKITNLLPLVPNLAESLEVLKKNKIESKYERKKFVANHKFIPEKFGFSEFKSIRFVPEPFPGDEYSYLKFKVKFIHVLLIILFEIIVVGVSAEINIEASLIVLCLTIIPFIILIPPKRKHKINEQLRKEKNESEKASHAKKEEERKKAHKASEKVRLNDHNKKNEIAQEDFEQIEREREREISEKNSYEKIIFEKKEDKKQAKFEYAEYAKKMHFTRLEKGCLEDIKAQIEDVLPIEVEKQFELEKFDYDVAYKVKNKKEIELIIVPPDEDVIPDHLLSFVERGGKIKRIDKSQKDFNADYFKFTSTFILWHGVRILFEIPTAITINIKSFKNAVSDVTGNQVYRKMLEVNVDRSIVHKINFQAVDPLKVLQNFEHVLEVDGKYNLQSSEEMESFDELDQGWIFADETKANHVELMKIIGEDFEEDEAGIAPLSIEMADQAQKEINKTGASKIKTGKNASLVTDLTEEEKKYAQIFLLAYQDRVIGESERSLLNMQADMFGMDEERQQQIEKSLKECEK